MKRKKVVGIIAGSIVMVTMLTVTIAAALGSGAYFKDASTQAENYITVGTLDITTNPSSGVIKVSNIAPGWNYHDASHWGYDSRYDVRVTNTGTLPVKYRMRAEGTGGNFNNALLDDVLAYVAVEDGKGNIISVFNGHLKDLFDWHDIYSNFGTSGHEGWYGKGQNVRIGLAVAPTIGNEIMGQSLEFNLVFEATQTTNPAW